MSNKNTIISCDVCLDLIPLVRDKVASDDSCTLVYEHIKTCKNCRVEFENMPTPSDTTVDDKKIILAIKKSFYCTGFIFIVFGALIGIYLSNSSGVFYNFLIMPIVGACAYLTLNEKSYFVPIAVFVLSYIWQFVQNIGGGALTSGFKLELFYTPLFFSFIYVCLTIVGIVIVALLKFAFKKEGE
jgi:hypothetical protein